MDVTWNQAGLAAIDRATAQLLEDSAAAIADACNSDSSWGGYDSALGDDGKARVWSADGRDDEARDQRLIRHLDAAAK